MSTCGQCNIEFAVTEVDRRFYEKVSPVFGGKKYLIPEPTLCPDCRQRRRLAWRNERSLYHRVCGLCKKSIVTALDEPYVVYCRPCWWSGNWDPLSHGRAFDFNQPFFPQLASLLKAVPQGALWSIDVENCDYANFQNDSRNCYLCFGSGFMEDCQYCDWVYYAKNTFDCSWCNRSERDYMNVDCRDTYHCQFCQDCHNIQDSFYCFDCKNCKNCFGCVGLRGKEYHLFNKPVSKSEYENFVTKLKDPQYAGHIQSEIGKLKEAHPHLATRMINSENCTGYDIDNSKNCFYCYTIQDCEDCQYMHEVLKCKDSQDTNRVGVNELTYEAVGGGYGHSSQFFAISAYVNFGQYFFDCFNSKFIFGAVGLNHKEYVILNKQYSKEAYEALVPKIIEHMRKTGEWGEFFSASICPFAYNETIAQDFFPLDQVSAESLGYRWKPKDQKEYLPPQGDIMACEVTGRNFKLTPQEIRFYNEEGLSTPTKHPNQRYAERLALKLPRRLYDRQCAKCQTAIETPYAPDRPEIVYCEKCYLQSVY